MIPGLFFLFIGIASFLALRDWRLGILLMLFAGALQDPVRKMMPGTPGWMVLAFTPILFAVLANVFLGRSQTWRKFIESIPSLRRSITFFASALLLSFSVLIAKSGLSAWMIGAIGLIGYLFPLLAIALGYFYVRDSGDLLRFIKVYCILTAVLLVSGLFEYYEIFPNWAAIGTDALNMYWIRHVPGYIVQLTSGFYRSPDLLGWNAALLVMFSMLMGLHSKGTAGRGFWIALAAWGVTILLLSGRNKMIFMPPIFIAVLAISYLQKGHISRVWTLMVTGVLTLALFLGINQQMRLDREYLDYVGVGSQTAAERVKSHGLLAVITTVQQSGFFGEGLGTASTGARYGGSAEHSKTWQESGTSKIMVELGVIGFIAVAMLLIRLLRLLWHRLKQLPPKAPEGLLFVGLLGILAANAASFTVSHQAFGDPFLVTLAGFFLGLALSAPRWAYSNPQTHPPAGLVN